MARRVKAPAVTVEVPQTRDQVVAAIAEIGRRERECQRIEAEMNEQLAAIKLRFESEGKPHADRIAALKEGVQIWCEANKEQLTEGGKRKTARFASGEVRWRMTPPAVRLRGVAAILAALAEKGLSRFIRTSQEVDKEAILKEPDAVKGVAGITIGQVEEFVIVPFETKLDEVA